MGRIVGIDYGRKRIGLSISDENKKIALPLTTLAAGKNALESAKKVFGYLSTFKEPPEKLVIGYPIKMNGQKSEMTEEVELFAESLQSITNTPQEYIDERLSSALSQTVLKEAGLSRKKRAKFADENAACIILQTFLDKYNYLINN